MMTHLDFSRCQIDFLQNPTTSHDQSIIFHVSVRPSENVIARNHYEFGRWGNEERYGQFRIRHKEIFEIYILADYEFYKIAVNGQHIGVFRHRLPWNLVNFVRVTGDVKVDHVLLEQDTMNPQSQSPIVVTQITTQQRPMPYGQSSIATNITAIPSIVPPPPNYTPMNVHVTHIPPQPITVSKRRKVDQGSNALDKVEFMDDKFLLFF
jgi:hypothetical protein